LVDCGSRAPNYHQNGPVRKDTVDALMASRKHDDKQKVL
jgi:hypothetical protein